MNHHTLAAISITGSCLDVLGSLYLAYDLLGGQQGPLRVITRAATYSIIFGLGYGLGLGLVFGLACGVATGATVAVEFTRAGRGQEHLSLRWEALFAFLRSFAFSFGLYRIVGLQFAFVYGLLLTLGQIFAYSRGMRPALDYSAKRKPRFTLPLFWGTVVRTVGYIVAALICGTMVRHIDHVWWFALRLGLVTGLVTGVGVALSPYVEYQADNMPERRMGVFGIGLMLCGFALQSVQYWLVLFDVPVR